MKLSDINWEIDSKDFKKDWFYAKNSGSVKRSDDNNTKINKRGNTSINNELMYDINDGTDSTATTVNNQTTNNNKDENSSEKKTSINNELIYGVSNATDSTTNSVNNPTINANKTESSNNSTTSINNELIYDINNKSSYNNKDTNGFTEFFKDNKIVLIIAGVSIILIAVVGLFIYKKKRAKDEKIKYEKSKNEPDIEINTLIKHNSLPGNNDIISITSNNTKANSENISTSPINKSSSEKQSNSKTNPSINQTVPEVSYVIPQQQQQFVNYIQPQLQVQPQTIIPLYNVPVPVTYVNPSASSLDSKSKIIDDSKSKIFDDTKLKNKEFSSQPYEATPVDNIPIINPELRSNKEVLFDEKKSLKETSKNEKSIDDKLVYLDLVNNTTSSPTFPILNEDKSINMEATFGNNQTRKF
ncbi:hypothetical protein LY90DRAFT_701315 [Neocallimastix californiae]|jgi:hypothetical protein|uniref:Uncharacterized protein n=1 Tax=Neocallimastix californiae TaxID=1754190 RepID=A0A1Y2DKR9_9FUNG|nr:hypothetical protein LY90DRAFT_701315 [Neocallimastix californiae]|eukprot:ORY59779.1 hypothetical protein LY90DRAFT_701315 [Neocallimastix californiae]